MKPMTSYELRDAVASLGLTQAQTAEAVGVSPRTMRAWLSGDAAVPQSAAIVIRLMQLGRLSVRACEKISNGEDFTKKDLA